MPPKRSTSTARSRSRKPRSTSTSRSRTPARSRSRRGSNGTQTPPPTAATSPRASSPKAAPSKASSRASAPDSIWEADAQLQAAMHPHRNRGKGSYFTPAKVRFWGTWAAIIAFQVILIIWAKWAVDMYAAYKASH